MTEPEAHKHDHFVKHMMHNTEVAKDFFDRHLPDHIKQLVDLQTLDYQNESYIDEQLKLSRIDLLFKINFKEKPGYIYTLFEHQSSVDKLMPFRMLQYMVKIMAKHLNSHNDLPIIYPIVLYHGRDGYYASTDIFDLFGEHKELAKSILFQPFNLIDVNLIPDEELKASVKSGIMEFVLKHIFDREILPCLEFIKNELKLIDTKNDNLLIVIFKYIMMNNDSSGEQVIDFVKKTFPSDRGEKMASIAEQFVEKGINIGMMQGIEKGIEKGMFEKSKQIAQKMLKVGTPIDRVAEVTDLSIDEIKRIQADS